MASGHLASRLSRCVACLALTAAATLGGLTAGEAHADQQTPTRAPARLSVTPQALLPSGSPAASHSAPVASGVPSAVPAHPAHPAPLPSLSPASATPSPTDDAAAPGQPSPSAGSPRPDDAQSPLAGRPAGEGRPRPGRTMTPEEIARADALEASEEEAAEEAEEEAEATEPAAVPAVTPEPSTSPGTGRMSRQALDGAAVEQVQQLSLGAGIALVGLGLGFLAFRIRRSV
ncbi:MULTISPECIES: hypothetical protein [unclassified Streptomyces]|uniref:hypothetical protein n=1 Tax=unclassified Streptomyces TaxID=2593676 RepID=UPI002DD8B045|nr:hypothetical protein [Streptomyces sp. NBC_01257]WRZ65917.1 hypothetical protein OG408_19420 [Streptomyces sp. NBC_01257]WSU59929.1 hypothetical protein OG450_19700 [Streptomyces sp. NBC_01104]